MNTAPGHGRKPISLPPSLQRLLISYIRGTLSLEDRLLLLARLEHIAPEFAPTRAPRRSLDAGMEE